MLNSTIKSLPKSLASFTKEIEHDCPGHRMYGQRPKMPKCSLIKMNNRKYLTFMVFGTILALTPSGNLHANRKSSDRITLSFRFSLRIKSGKVIEAKIRSSGRAAEGDGLENRCTVRYRGFESLLLRFNLFSDRLSKTQKSEFFTYFA